MATAYLSRNLMNYLDRFLENFSRRACWELRFYLVKFCVCTFRRLNSAIYVDLFACNYQEGKIFWVH